MCPAAEGQGKCAPGIFPFPSGPSAVRLDGVMRFFETLFRHWRLAALPVVLGLVIAAGYTVSQPREFTSTASVWVDASVPGNGLNNNSNQYVDPSTVEQSEMQELLTTRSFAVAVGHSGPLAAYLAGHPGSTVTGLGAVPGLSAFFGGSKGSVDDQVAADLPNMVSLVATGPQVVNITVTAPAPQVAAGTAKALISEYTTQMVAAQAASDKVSVQYYGQQVSQAESALQKAQQTLSEYLAAHPGVPANGAGDATATLLYQAVTLNSTTYQNALSQYQDAELNLANVDNQVGFRVLDAPTANGSPVSIKKKLLGAGIAGLIIGIIISVLIISFLTAADKSARRAAEIKRALGVEVAASIDLLPGGTLPSGVHLSTGEPVAVATAARS